ncbi:hypothetical protein [Micromonospora phytophila]|nr:hypothetical protein [Micromonospora phytophila]
MSQNPDHAVGGEQRVSLAAPAEKVPGLLDRWRSAFPGRRSWSAG